MKNPTPSASRVMLAYSKESSGIVSLPEAKPLPVTKVIYREPEEAQETLGRFGGDPDDVEEPTIQEDHGSKAKPRLAPVGDEKVKGNSYRSAPDHKPPRRKANPKSYTHEKNREYQQTFKDLNGDRK